eukprot:Phypoly_transcript_00182.p1 GENE.Phypoly_transcript_00182~~Phypoly_transcript_00182.p1  ORF type:complete len:2033 (+),score=208.26 Phypoly_transcript_00182:30-6101(+)
MTDSPLRFKVVVVGDDILSAKHRNLKTELLVTYSANAFPQDYVPTVFDNYKIQRFVNGHPVVVDFLNTAGQAEYDRLRPLSYANANLFMLVFSVVHDTSFESITTKWYSEVQQTCPEVPVLLVGLNTYNRNRISITTRQRSQGRKTISTEMGESLKERIDAVAYRECDASRGFGIKEMFETVLRVAWMNIVEQKHPSTIANHPNIPPMRVVYSMLFSEAHISGNIEAMCNVRDSRDQSDPKVLEATEAIIAFEIAHKIRQATKELDLSRCDINFLPPKYCSKLKKLEELNLSHNRLHKSFEGTSVWKVTAMDLSWNNFFVFPINLKLFPHLRVLSLAHNFIKEIPESVAQFSNLKLDVSYNSIESLPNSLLEMNIDATGNPLASVLPAYRMDKDKILMYLKNMQSQSTVEWKQVKLMLFGQESVGKTTLLRAMRKEKSDPELNISTNGVNIAQMTIGRTKPQARFNLFIRKQKKSQQVKFSVWDFGGQSVFHSTHRLFITPFALYVVLYDMSKPETRERVKYWIDQIGDDAEFSKPILIVGTHADLLSKEERTKVIREMDALYPTPPPNKAHCTKIQGHCAVSLLPSDKGSLVELTNKLVDLALDHPKIGVRHVKVPKWIELLQTELEEIRAGKQYLWWSDYVALFKTLDIPEEYIHDNTAILHDIGAIVWHNVPKLRDVVIINPQWLADAMAGVVSFMCQAAVAKTAGMTSWQKMKESLRLKFPDSAHSIAVSMLEFFEIIYKMKTPQGVKALQQNAELIDEQMFFVPSLLSPFLPERDHPALQYWNSLDSTCTFVRRFSWKIFPSGFFPRLLLRLVHLRMKPLVCWLDAAVILGKDGTECAFMRLSQKLEDSSFFLEVLVKAKDTDTRNEKLVAQIAYVVSQLHHDMYVHGRSQDAPLVHQIVVPHKNAVLSFEECIKAEIEGRPIITVGGQSLRINQFLPDLNECKQIPSTAIQILERIGKGGFGEVFKGILKSHDIDGANLSIVVALKELQRMDEPRAFYDFQHEVMIMSKLRHVNLVHLYGIVKAPLRMVIEYVPKSDLHSLLKIRQVLPFKLKLKIAIDCASGVSYLHSQSPAICHSDLRAPNIFLASLDEDSPVIAKVADFGLSRQLFPFSQQTLHNIMETAPETWEGNSYDEKSDVFSFAIILWRLFGSKAQNGALVESQVQGEDEIDESEHEYLKKHGKFFPPPKQRDVIRKGGRPPIHCDCPIALRNLVERCWHTSPEYRPSFTSILGQLMRIYANNFSEDNYIVLKRKELDPEEQLFRQTNSVEYVFHRSVFQSHNWNQVHCEGFSGTPTTVLELPAEVWVGTRTRGLAMFDKESSQFIRHKILQNSELQSCRISTKRTVLLSTGDSCVWAAVDSEIHIISTVTRDTITVQLQNIYPITSMVLLPSNFVWVADTEGFISIWDAQTLQKCYRFRVHPHNCPQTMAVIHNYVCMAVGRELIAVHMHTLDAVTASPAHRDRIHDIVAVPHCNQVWTCTRDGSVSAWVISMAPSSNQPEMSQSPQYSESQAPCPISPPTSALSYDPPLADLTPSPLSPTSSPAEPTQSTLKSSLPILRSAPLPLSPASIPFRSASSPISPTTSRSAASPVRCASFPVSPTSARAAQHVLSPKSATLSSIRHVPAPSPALPPLTSPLSPTLRTAVPIKSWLRSTASPSRPTSPPPQLTLSPPPSRPNITESLAQSPLSPVQPRTPSTTQVYMQLKFNTNLKTPVKCACILSDGGHICVGTFEGSIYAWNVQTFEQHSIPMPAITKGRNIPCLLDTEYGLWCSVEGIEHPLMFHRHSTLSHQTEVLACRAHNRKFHDAFINYRVFCEGSNSLASPVEALYKSLSAQKKKKSIGEVTVFWDEQCLNYGQNWERSFFHAITASKVVILLISALTLEGIKKNAENKQDNVLVEYECAIMQNKLHKKPVIPVFIAGAQMDTQTKKLRFSPFDFKDLDPASFPRTPHARGDDIQYIVDNMSKSLSANDQKFLNSIAATIEQLGKLQGYLLTKRGTDELELQKIVDQVMEELEK